MNYQLISTWSMWLIDICQEEKENKEGSDDGIGDTDPHHNFEVIRCMYSNSFCCPACSAQVKPTETNDNNDCK